MIRVFSSTLLTVALIIVTVVAGGVLGYCLPLDPNSKLSPITYGFIAFAVLPITICLFGLKELNGAFSSVVKHLTGSQQEKLIKQIDKRYDRTIELALFVILIQVVFAFALLLIGEKYRFVVLGVLFGGVISVLFYGLYVCYTVRNLIKFCDNCLADQERDKKKEAFKKRLTGP